MKTAASTRIEESVFQRLEHLAKTDKRTVANVIELCIEGFLPVLEKEVLGDEFAGVKVANGRPEHGPAAGEPGKAAA